MVALAAAAALAIIICAPADPLRAALDDDELAEIERCTPRCCTAAAAAAAAAPEDAAAAAPLLLAATVAPATAAVAPWWDGVVPTTLPDVKGMILNVVAAVALNPSVKSRSAQPTNPMESKLDFSVLNSIIFNGKIEYQDLYSNASICLLC